MTMREKNIERRLVNGVEDQGGKAYKFTSPGKRDVPDRLVVLSNPPRIIFVECKAPGQKPRPGQVRVIDELRAMGHDVRVVDSVASVDQFIEEI